MSYTNTTLTTAIKEYTENTETTFVNTVEVPFRFYPCLAAGLAYYLSIKRAPDRVALLKSMYEEEFNRAAFEDIDRANLSLTPRRDFYGFG